MYSHADSLLMMALTTGTILIGIVVLMLAMYIDKVRTRRKLKARMRARRYFM